MTTFLLPPSTCFDDVLLSRLLNMCPPCAVRRGVRSVGQNVSGEVEWSLCRIETVATTLLNGFSFVRQVGDQFLKSNYKKILLTYGQFSMLEY